MSREPTPALILDLKAIPVLRGADPTSIGSKVQALVDGGLPIVEVTVEQPGALAAIQEVDSSVLVGAGSVADPRTAMDAVAAGAQFIVSPHLNQEIVQACVQMRIPVVAGALTPTEIKSAWDAGASAVKVFPASLGGTEYISAITAPFPDIELIPTGGINDRNAGAFLKAGACAVGVGGWLTASEEPSLISERTRKLLEATTGRSRPDDG